MCSLCSVLIARSRPATARCNSRDRRAAYGARRCGSVRRCGARASMPKCRERPSLGAGAQGQRQSEGPQRQSRADVRPQRLGSVWRRTSGCSRALSLAGNKLTFEDIDSVAAGSRLRGHLAVTLDEEKAVDGEVGLDSLDLAPALRSRSARPAMMRPSRSAVGLMKGWRGRIAFQALRGELPGGGELRPVSGTVKSDGQSLTFDGLKGKLGGGDATATIDARPDPNGIAINSRVDFAGVDGNALHYRGLKMPAGRTSLQMTLMSRGRSVAALAGALSGSGTVTLESASIPGPRSARLRGRGPRQRRRAGHRRQQIEADRRAGAGGRAPAGRDGANSLQHPRRAASHRRDHARCRQRPRHRFRRLRHAGRPGRRSRQSCRQLRSARRAAAPKSSCSPPGRPMRSIRTLDVTSLSSWLAVRTIDRETRRLDAIERGEPPPVEPPFVSAIDRGPAVAGDAEHVAARPAAVRRAAARP